VNGFFDDRENTTEQEQKANISKRLWSYVKGKKNDQIGVASLKDPAGTVSDDTSKAELLNTFFTKVFTVEDTHTIPTPDGNPSPIMPDIKVNEQGVCAQLKRLNPQNAQGPGEIPLRVLKEASQQLAPLLTYIFNQSLNTGKIVKDWSTANVVSIHKKGDQTDPNNYRPVSLTAVPCKILEHIIHHNIMKHSDTNSIIYAKQHGFRKKHSTESQLILTIEDLAHRP
jgi:hypothetical protein